MPMSLQAKALLKIDEVKLQRTDVIPFHEFTSQLDILIDVKPDAYAYHQTVIVSEVKTQPA
jgi:hypothetical protein